MEKQAAEPLAIVLAADLTNRVFELTPYSQTFNF